MYSRRERNIPKRCSARHGIYAVNQAESPKDVLNNSLQMAGQEDFARLFFGVSICGWDMGYAVLKKRKSGSGTILLTKPVQLLLSTP